MKLRRRRTTFALKGAIFGSGLGTSIAGAAPRNNMGNMVDFKLVKGKRKKSMPKKASSSDECRHKCMPFSEIIFR